MVIPDVASGAFQTILNTTDRDVVPYTINITFEKKSCTVSANSC